MAMTAITFNTYALIRGEDGVVKMGYGSRPSPPTPDVANGCLFWDTDDHKFYHWTGSVWDDDVALGTVTIANGDVNITSGDINVTSGDITLTDGNLTVNGIIFGDNENIALEDCAGIKAAVENEGGRSKAQKVVNILGSLAVINAISGETVRARNVRTTNTLTVGNQTLTPTSGGLGLTLAGESAAEADLTLTSGNMNLSSGGNYLYVPPPSYIKDGTYRFLIQDVAGIKMAPPNAGGRSIAQRVANILGSLAVTSGFSADSVRSRTSEVTSTATVGGAATLRSTLAVTGTTALTGQATLALIPTVTAYKLAGSKALAGGVATTFVSVAAPSNGVCGGQIPYTIVANDSTDYQVRTGVLCFAATNKAGTVSLSIKDNLIGATAQSGTTTGITATFSGAEDAANTLAIKCNAASDLTETTLTIYYEVQMQYTNTITAA